MCRLSCFILMANSSVLVRLPLWANAIPKGALVYRGWASAEQPLPPSDEICAKSGNPFKSACHWNLINPFSCNLLWDSGHDLFQHSPVSSIHYLGWILLQQSRDLCGDSICCLLLLLFRRRLGLCAEAQSVHLRVLVCSSFQLCILVQWFRTCWTWVIKKYNWVNASEHC